MSEEEQEEILEEIKENLISLADWCQQENNKIDRLLEGRSKGHEFDR